MRSHHTFMMLSGVSLCVISASIIHLRSGGGATYSAGVETRIAAPAVSSVSSADVFSRVTTTERKQRVAAAESAEQSILIRSSQGLTTSPQRELRSRPHSVTPAKQEQDTSSFTALRNAAESETFVPVSSEEALRVSMAPDATSLEPSAVQSAAYYGYRQTSGTGATAIVVKVDPRAPGNSVTSNGQRLAVDAYASKPEGSELELDLVVDADTPSDAGNVSQGGLAEERDPRRGQAPKRGFTYEEELFRTKWGWAAFNQVQQAARGGAWDSRR